MFAKFDRIKARRRRHLRTRERVLGNAQRPRLSVHRSSRHVVVQLVNDESGHTVVAASTHEAEMRKALKTTGNEAAAIAVGTAVAARAKAAGIEAVVFDRNGYPYHGVVKAVADAVRAAGVRV